VAPAIAAEEGAAESLVAGSAVPHSSKMIAHYHVHLTIQLNKLRCAWWTGCTAARVPCMGAFRSALPLCEASFPAASLQQCLVIWHSVCCVPHKAHAHSTS
jgi:hypothetical protein